MSFAGLSAPLPKRRPRTQVLTGCRSLTRWAESPAPGFGVKINPWQSLGWAVALCAHLPWGDLALPPQDGCPQGGASSRGPPTGWRVTQTSSSPSVSLPFSPSALCTLPLPSRCPASRGRPVWLRDWDIVGQGICRLLLDPLGLRRAMTVALLVMSLLVAKLPCFRADQPRVESRSQHSVILGKLLNPSEPRFPPL